MPGVTSCSISIIRFIPIKPDSCAISTNASTNTFSNSSADPKTYRLVLTELGLSGPECVMVDDYAVNLVPARELGMTTVYLGREPWETDPLRTLRTLRTLRYLDRLSVNVI